MDKKIIKNVSIIIAAVVLVIFLWFTYSLIRFDGFFSPIYTFGLSNPYKYYQEHIGELLLEHGQKYRIDDIDTSDWKIYEDKDLGFEFKYPENFKVEIKEMSNIHYDIYFADIDDSKICNIEVDYPGKRGTFSDLGKNSLPSKRRRAESYSENSNKERLWYIETKNEDILRVGSTRFMNNEKELKSEGISFTGVTFIDRSSPYRFVKITDYQNKCFGGDARGIFATFQFATK